jgi:hypothetical protein
MVFQVSPRTKCTSKKSKKKQLSPFSQFILPMLFFPNFPIVNPNNEQHNLENKNLKNDRLEG